MVNVLNLNPTLNSPAAHVQSEFQANCSVMLRLKLDKGDIQGTAVTRMFTDEDSRLESSDWLENTAL